MCTDYRALNKSTVLNRFLMPTVDEQLNNLARVAEAHCFFSCLDLYLGFWQVPVPPEDRDKTAFVTHDGLFRCTAMPFGLVNAPAVFQRMMTTALADCIARGFCRVYIDDIVVYSKTLEEHVAHLEAVLSAISTNRLVCKPSKCFFGFRQIVHLGHLAGAGDRDPSRSPPTGRFPARSFAVCLPAALPLPRSTSPTSE